jgi:hypothetical protein
MSDLILFYKNIIPANGKEGYYLNDILKWSDLELEVRHDYIQWLFPLETAGQNASAPTLTEDDIITFQTDPDIREMVFKATLKMLRFYGFSLNTNWSVDQIRKLDHIINGQVIGLYSEHNYLRITRIMKFLNIIRMERLSEIFFLTMCETVSSDETLHKKVKGKTLQFWMNTQPFLQSFVQMSRQDNSEECGLKGLSNIQNSCYLDSVLIILLGVPSTLSREILSKDLHQVSYSDTQDITCSQNKEEDFLIRSSVQGELRNITRSIRGEGHIEYCSNLRRLLSRCQTRDKYHGEETQDSAHFLAYLLNIFQVYSTIGIRYNFVSNDPDFKKYLKTFGKDAKFSPLWAVRPEDLHSNTSLQDLLSIRNSAELDDENRYRDSNGDLYRYRQEVMQIIDADYIIFNTIRLKMDRYGMAMRNIAKLVVPQFIEIGAKTLELIGVVIHYGNHYTCLVKCGKFYYLYDDLRRVKFNRIGTYENIFDIQPDPGTHGTLYFYKKA